MRTSWKRQPFKGNTLSSWKEAYNASVVAESVFEVECLYEDVSAGTGQTIEEARADFCENIRLKIGELAEMLQYCASNQPTLKGPKP